MTWELQEVPGRSLILFHRGNVPEDVEGCIALGMAHGFIKDEWAVIRSREAFEAFFKVMEHETRESEGEFVLVIRSHFEMAQEGW